MVLPTPRASLPSSVNLWKSPCRCAQCCVPWQSGSPEAHSEGHRPRWQFPPLPAGHGVYHPWQRLQGLHLSYTLLGHLCPAHACITLIQVSSILADLFTYPPSVNHVYSSDQPSPWGLELAQRVESLVCKSQDLSLVLGFHEVAEENWLQRWSSNHTCIAARECTCKRMCACTHTLS